MAWIEGVFVVATDGTGNHVGFKANDTDETFVLEANDKIEASTDKKWESAIKRTIASINEYSYSIGTTTMDTVPMCEGPSFNLSKTDWSTIVMSEFAIWHGRLWIED